MPISNYTSMFYLKRQKVVMGWWIPTHTWKWSFLEQFWWWFQDMKCHIQLNFLCWWTPHHVGTDIALFSDLPSTSLSHKYLMKGYFLLLIHLVSKTSTFDLLNRTKILWEHHMSVYPLEIYENSFCKMSQSSTSCCSECSCYCRVCKQFFIRYNFLTFP